MYELVKIGEREVTRIGYYFGYTSAVDARNELANLPEYREFYLEVLPFGCRNVGPDQSAAR